VINEKFFKDWEDFIKFNSKIEIIIEPKQLTDKIYIPLTNIEINAYVFHKIVEFFYPKLMDEHLNWVDIVISSDDKGKKVLMAFTQISTKPGIVNRIIPMNTDDLKHFLKKSKNIEDIFDNIQKFVFKKTGVKISAIHLYDEKILDLINESYNNLENQSHFESIKRLLSFLQKCFLEDLIKIYPESSSFHFLKQYFRLYGKLNLSNLFGSLKTLMKGKSGIFIFKMEDLYLSLKIFDSKVQAKRDIDHDMYIELLNEEQVLELQDDPNKFLKKAIRDFKLDFASFFKLEPLLEFLIDLFKQDLPLQKDDFCLMMQKIVFSFRSFENFWFVQPHPIISNTLVRFLLRIFGFNINIKKLSHWNLPDFFFNLLFSSLGFNSNILTIIAEKKKKANILKHAMMLKFEDGALTSLTPLKSSDLKDFNLDDPRTFRINRFKEKYELLTIVIINSELLKYFISFILGVNKRFLILRLLKLFKLLKNDKNLLIYPKNIVLELIKKKRSIILLKYLLDISMDKFEF